MYVMWLYTTGRTDDNETIKTLQYKYHTTAAAAVLLLLLLLLHCTCCVVLLPPPPLLAPAAPLFSISIILLFITTLADEMDRIPTTIGVATAWH